MQKGFAPILIVIIVAVLGIGGYFVYTNYSNKRTKIVPVQQTFQGLPTSDETAWKAYTITNYGVQFSTPPVQKEGFFNDYYNAQKLVGNPNTIDGCKSYGMYARTLFFDLSLASGFGMDISFWLPLHKVKDGKSWYEACLKKIYYPNRNPQTEVSIINGKEVFIVKDRNRSGNSGTKDYDQYIFVNNGIVYMFNFSNHIGKVKTDQQVQKILNSIQFSEPIYK